MIKNDLKLNMLFAVLAIFVTSCSVNNRSVQQKSPDVNNTSYLRNQIEDYAKKQIGVKYKYAGKNPRGFDCSGFTSYVFQEFDVALSASSKLQAKQGKSVNLKWVKKGDLLFFGTSGKISHVALVVDNKDAGIYVIHSTSSRGVIVENVSKSTYWKKRIMFAKNVIGN
jgi:cell wall-associated NlpC family hydrolase